jgi:adenylylsulfate kinase
MTTTQGELLQIVTMISETNGIGQKLVSVDPGADQGRQGLTVWFTGLSGAGKTTICRSVHAELSTRGYRVEMLDADVVRKQLWPDLGFSKGDRDENIRRIGYLAQLLTRNGVIALVAAISPYRAARNEVRDNILRFLEVHVDAPLRVCEERDPKGLYRRARSGDLPGFTGIDDPYEAPLAPEIRCATDRDTVNTCRDQVVSAVLKYLS